jgi:hypothetical protein
VVRRSDVFVRADDVDSIDGGVGDDVVVGDVVGEDVGRTTAKREGGCGIVRRWQFFL